jgi:predicted porin
MKKSLLILAAVASASAAHAQSFVTLAGTVDSAFSYGKGSLSKRQQLISGGNATSKLIFRGSEDLGGGMSANFWLETGFTADNGAFQATNTNNQPTGAAGGQGLTFNRRSDVWLASSWGELHLGRLWGPYYEAYTGKYDPFGLAVGIGVNYTASINPALIRVSNAVAYHTPRFSGFGAQVHKWFGENASNTPTEDDGSGMGVRLYYDKGPFSAIYAHSNTQFAAGDAKTHVIGAVYNWGPVKTSFNANRAEQGALKQKGFLVGLWVPVGVGEIKASYSTIKQNTAGDPDIKKLAIGYVHHLSKRTALYATAAHVNNGGSSTHSLNGSTTTAGGRSSGFDLGIRHNF